MTAKSEQTTSVWMRTGETHTTRFGAKIAAAVVGRLVGFCIGPLTEEMLEWIIWSKSGGPWSDAVGGWLSVKAGLARLPDGVGWGMILAGGCLAGIGFTMALFVASLALEGDLLDTAKIGILVASLVSAMAEMLLLVRCTSSRSE